MNECVVAFLMMLLLGSGQTFLTLRSIKEVETNLSKKQNYSNLSPKSSIPSSIPAETTTSVYICMEVSPNLPPCNFDKSESSIKEEESLIEVHGMRKREINIPKSLIIYKIEGCIPSRLPFRLPFCKPEESRSPLANVQNLRPFKTKEVYRTAPEIFPKFNYTQWLDQIKYVQLEHQVQSQSENKHNFSIELENTSGNRGKQRREIESMKPIKRKSKTSEKYNTNEMFLVKNWYKSENEESHKKKNKMINMKKTIHKTQKRIEEDIQEARGLDQELDKLVAELEFPYSRAIPFDPKKLQVARKGSEFPYSKAIPFDAEKLQVARERSVFPYWKEILYRPNIYDFDYSNEISYEDNHLYPKRNHHSRRLQSIEKNRAVSFDFLEDGIFPFSKQVSRDVTSRNIEDSESFEKNNQEKKTSVLQRESTILNDLKKPESASVRNEGYSLKQPHYLSRKLRFIKEGSEFPYTKAIPFDAAKLSAARRKSESKYSKLTPDSKEYISRKPLAFNAGNNLSSFLLVPHNRRASIHHPKDQRGKSS